MTDMTLSDCVLPSQAFSRYVPCGRVLYRHHIGEGLLDTRTGSCHFTADTDWCKAVPHEEVLLLPDCDSETAFLADGEALRQAWLDYCARACQLPDSKSAMATVFDLLADMESMVKAHASTLGTCRG